MTISPTGMSIASAIDCKNCLFLCEAVLENNNNNNNNKQSAYSNLVLVRLGDLLVHLSEESVDKFESIRVCGKDEVWEWEDRDPRWEIILLFFCRYKHPSQYLLEICKPISLSWNTIEQYLQITILSNEMNKNDQDMFHIAVIYSKSQYQLILASRKGENNWKHTLDDLDKLVDVVLVRLGHLDESLRCRLVEIHVEPEHHFFLVSKIKVKVYPRLAVFFVVRQRLLGPTGKASSSSECSLLIHWSIFIHSLLENASAKIWERRITSELSSMADYDNRGPSILLSTHHSTSSNIKYWSDRFSEICVVRWEQALY